MPRGILARDPRRQSTLFHDGLLAQGPAVRARQRRSLFSVSSPLARVPHLRLTLATAQPSATQPTRGNTHEAFIVTTTQASRLLSPAVSRDQPSTSKTRIRVRALVARPSVAIMVCAKCQKLSKGTTLATPEVKKKSEMYYGSPASSSKAAGANKSTTLAQSGIGKAGDLDQRQTCLFADTPPEQALVQVGQKSIRPVLEVRCDSSPPHACTATDRGITARVRNAKPKSLRDTLSAILAHTKTMVWRLLHLCRQLTPLTTKPACAMCGKPNKKSSSKAPTVSGQKFTLK